MLACIQVCGRLCGIDPVGTVKTLWCSEKEHELHQTSINTVQYIVDKLLRNGISAQDAIAKTRKLLVDLTDDTPVVSDIVVDEEGAIAQLGGTKITRPNAGKRIRDMAVDTKRMATSKKMKLTSEEYESGLSHSAVTTEATDIEAPVADPGVLSQMREAIHGVSGEGVVQAIKGVINDNGGSVDFDRVPTDMASRDQFPDGTAFSPTVFLKFIVREKMDLLVRNGIQYVSGVFSLA